MYHQWNSDASGLQYTALANKFNNKDYVFSNTMGSLFARPIKGGPAQALPQATRIKGLVRVGSSFYSMPGAGLNKSNQVVPPIHHLYGQFASGSNNPIQAIRDLDYGPRSVTSNTLGVDYTLAFNRSKSFFAGDMRVDLPGNSQTLSAHLGKVAQLLKEYNLSGGRNLSSRQQAAEDYYAQLMAAAHGKEIAPGVNVYASTLKDAMFREHGVLSLLGAHDITFNMSAKQLGKGLHQFNKLAPIASHMLEAFGLKGPVATGAAYLEETKYVQELIDFEGRELYNRALSISGNRLGAGNFVTRFSANTFYAIGQRTAAGMEASKILGDSRSVAGDELYRVSSGVIDGMGAGRKNIIIAGIKNYDDLKIHKALRDDVVSILEHIKGNVGSLPDSLEVTESGVFLYKPERIKRLHARKGNQRKIHLGRSVPLTQGPVSPIDVKHRDVFAPIDRSGLEIIGYKPTAHGDGALEILYRTINKNQGPRESAMIIGGRRVMQHQVPGLNMNISGTAVHQVMRASEVGVGASVGEDFALRYMQHLFGSSSNLDPLVAAMNKASGNNLKIAKDTSGRSIVHWANEGASSSAFASIMAIQKLNPEELASVGLKPEDIKYLNVNGNNLTFNQSALDTINVGGENLLGFLLRGQDTSFRAGVFQKANIGAGALNMRLTDFLVTAMAHGGIRGNQELVTGIRNYILQGNRTSKSMPGVNYQTAAEELASFVFGLTGKHRTNIAGQSIKASAKVFNVQDYANLGRALGGKGATLNSVRGIISGGPITAGMAEGTAHAVGYKNEIIRLPKKIGVIVGENKIIETNMIPILSDEFLGQAMHAQGKHIGGGGIRGLGLVKTKAELLGLVSEHGTALARGEDTKGTRLLLSTANQYMQKLVEALPGKDGLLYHQLVGQPSGAWRAHIVNPESLKIKTTNPNAIFANPEDMFEMMNNGGYFDHLKPHQRAELRARVIAGEESLHAPTMAVRYPIHSATNLHASQMYSHPNVVKGTVAVHRGQYTMSKGDLDADTMSGFVSREMHEPISKAARHRTKFVKEFERQVFANETRAAQETMNQLSKDTLELIAGDTPDIAKTLAGRMSGAAGGGAMVGPIHMFWSKHNVMANMMFSSESSKWTKHVQQTSPELFKELSEFAKDTDQKFLSSVMQEAGVYGTLKKGSTGFGAKNKTAIEALIEFGENGYSLEQTKEVFREGFGKAFDDGQLSLAGLDKYGINETSSKNDVVNKVVSLLFGEGTQHQGIGTVAKLRSFIKSEGLSDPSFESQRGLMNNESDQIFALNRAEQALEAIGANVQGTVIDQSNPAHAASVDALHAINDEIKRTAEQIAIGAEKNLAQRAADEAATLSSTFMSRASNFLKTPWGKTSMAIGGAILGLGAIDAVFGASGDDYEAPQFDMTNAPLPPMATPVMPDSDDLMPTQASFRNMARAPARIERPNSIRQHFNVNGEASDRTNFNYIMDGSIGTLGGPPPSNSYITYNNKKREDDTYYIKNKIRSSF